MFAWRSLRSPCRVRSRLSSSSPLPGAGLVPEQAISAVDEDQWREMMNMDYDELANYLEDQTPRKRKRKETRTPRKSPLFKDKARVKALAGNGGNGLVSFYRGPRERTGPPDGGDGGNGGHVIVRALDMEPNLRSVRHFYRAPHGGPGAKNNRAGKNGASIFIDVPVGTVVTEYFPPISKDEMDEGEEIPFEDMGFISLDELEEEDVEEVEVDSEVGPSPDVIASEGNDDDVFIKAARRVNKSYTPPRLTKEWSRHVDAEQEVLFDDAKEEERPSSREGTVGRSVDLDQAGAFVVIAKGGRGGRGNRRRATGGNRTPKIAGKGVEGASAMFNLELKLIAQVGLVGFPNAGKSSFLRSVSNATPKVANYPFTTIRPHLGTIQFKDTESLTVADLPGLIEGAHEDRGMGHEFLKHIERTKVLCYVIDMAGTEQRNPWNDYLVLLDEINRYNPALLSRPSLILANKMDLPDAEVYLLEFQEKLAEFPSSTNLQIPLSPPPLLSISARDTEGISEVANELRDLLEDLAEQDGFSGTGRYRAQIQAHDLSAQYEKYFED